MSTANNTTGPPLTLGRLHYLKRAPCPEMKGFHDCMPQTIVPHLAEVHDRKPTAQPRCGGVISGCLFNLTFLRYTYHVDLYILLLACIPAQVAFIRIQPDAQNMKMQM